MWTTASGCPPCPPAATSCPQGAALRACRASLALLLFKHESSIPDTGPRSCGLRRSCLCLSTNNPGLFVDRITNTVEAHPVILSSIRPGGAVAIWRGVGLLCLTGWAAAPRAVVPGLFRCGRLCLSAFCPGGAVAIWRGARPASLSSCQRIVDTSRSARLPALGLCAPPGYGALPHVGRSCAPVPCASSPACHAPGVCFLLAFGPAAPHPGAVPLGACSRRLSSALALRVFALDKHHLRPLSRRSHIPFNLQSF